MLFKTIVLCCVLVNVLATESSLRIPNLDHIFDTLSKNEWDADEVACRDNIFNVLENVKNSTLWATWVWNSIDQSPTGIFFGARYQLGNYDQCLRPPWLATHPELRTQYCLAEIEMHKNGVKKIGEGSDPYVRAEDYYVDTTTPYGRSFSYIAHGVCLPAGCPNKSVEKFVKALLGTGYLRAARDAAVSVHHCEEAAAPWKYSTGYYVFAYTFAALLSIAVGSTYYISEYPVTASSNSFVNQFAKSFCLRRNWNTIFKTEKDELPCLHGIRFLTAFIIAFVHCMAISHGTSISNALDFERMATDRKVLAYLTTHFDVIVDTFFTLSAILAGKSLATMDITKPYSLMKNILKRYIRLVVLLAVSVFYLGYMSKHTDAGPVYPKIAFYEQQTCEKNWLPSLLMIGNYYNTSEMCHPATWYIPCDFHMYVITLLLLYVYRKNPRVGKALAAVILVIGFIMPVITVYVNDLPAVLAYNLQLEVDIRPNSFFRNLYIKTHCRMVPYAIGLAAGYLMSIYKPKDYRKVWSKTVSFLGTYVSLNLMCAVIALGHICYLYGVHGWLACVFVAFERILFALAIVGVVIFCTYGQVPLINSFLSWSVFAPFSRLSYGVYVIHIMLLYQTSSMRDNMKHHLFEGLIQAVGLVVFSSLMSLLVWLLVEAPLVNITNPYLDTKASAKEKVEISRNGAHQSYTSKQKSM
ncbi:nose resistant to fluoxetine protein 6-like [Leguminivora glycinivorella]|uniref:nose resistant to fluoxetine protein 6-like n=1 Tax=Leguminivora glycinivorella TaxID=1035111 RepID=UPI00200F724A|nr:nose resistant to fluoxetine protein 6-like [Leguminivora glycinivorella]